MAKICKSTDFYMPEIVDTLSESIETPTLKVLGSVYQKQRCKNN